MPGFPDKFTPFYVAPPGSFVSGATATAAGTVMRFLRHFTKDSLNREVLWDKQMNVPSGWSPQRGAEPILERFVHYFYRKRQFIDGVEPGRTIPETKFSDGFEVETMKRDTPMTTGQSRRLAKVERLAAARSASA